MKKRSIGTIAAAALAVFLLAAQSASAATEVGSNCTASTASPGITAVQISKDPSDPLPLTVPAAGVVTKWRVNVIPFGGSIPQKLKVFQSTANPLEFRVTGESATETVVSGTNTFNTRIPVQTGDRFGLFGPAPTGGALLCVTASNTDVVGLFAGEVPNNTTGAFKGEPKRIAAVSTTIEPDADGDGYGDETQDQCPQNAAVQVPCPVVTLSASSIVKKGSVRVLITSNIQTPVTVAGTVNLGKGKKARLNGGTQVVVPGTIAKFTLLFPAALKERLKALSRKQSLQIALTATAPNIVGSPTVSSLKAKAKGQKKPARKGKGKAKKG